MVEERHGCIGKKQLGRLTVVICPLLDVKFLVAKVAQAIIFLVLPRSVVDRGIRGEHEAVPVLRIRIVLAPPGNEHRRGRLRLLEKGGVGSCLDRIKNDVDPKNLAQAVRQGFHTRLVAGVGTVRQFDLREPLRKRVSSIRE